MTKAKKNMHAAKKPKRMEGNRPKWGGGWWLGVIFLSPLFFFKLQIDLAGHWSLSYSKTALECSLLYASDLSRGNHCFPQLSVTLVLSETLSFLKMSLWLPWLSLKHFWIGPLSTLSPVYLVSFKEVVRLKGWGWSPGSPRVKCWRTWPRKC